jgi:hypothetical protein
MSSSAFINAVIRFTSVRCKVKLFRSDRGTNFVGAVDDLKIDAINVEDGRTRGREFMIAHTSAMKVVNTSCVRVFPVVLTSIELSICRAVRIIRSQKLFRSDRGTNFVGAVDDLKIGAINVEDGPFKNHLYNFGTVWKFNSPHSSHMGGAWE